MSRPLKVNAWPGSTAITGSSSRSVAAEDASVLDWPSVRVASAPIRTTPVSTPSASIGRRAALR